MKKRLLFVAYSFPPLNAASSTRTWNIARHLTGIGWDVTVLTLDPSLWAAPERSAEVARDIEALGIRRMVTGHRWRVGAAPVVRLPRGVPFLARRILLRLGHALHVEPELGWARAAEAACASLRPGDFDLVLATAPPFASFGVAARVAARLGCRYVLDYRDLWTGNPHRRHPRPTLVREEQALLAGAAAVTVVSPSAAEMLRQHVPDGPPVHVLPNGFDRDQLDVTAPPHDHFAIVYAGEFYPPKRTIDPLMRALFRIDGENQIDRDWRFHYYGSGTAHVQAAAQAAGLPASRLVIHGRVSRRTALEGVASADLAVVVTTVDREATLAERGIVTSKIHEAVGLGRQMLVIAPPGSDVETVLAETGLGRRFSGDDLEEIVSFIVSRARGAHVPARSPERYEWRNIAQRLDEILSTAVDGERYERTATSRG